MKFNDRTYLFDIEDMRIRIDARMEHSIFKHNFRHIAVGIIIRYDNLKSMKKDILSKVLLMSFSLPEDSLLVWSLPDEEDPKPRERGVRRGDAVNARQLLF